MTRMITLTTDLGDLYAAQMKGVLYSQLPPGSVVDLTHSVPAHAVAEGAFLLLHMGRAFPPGTVHLAVVDPGVGGERAPLAVATEDGSFLVGPDNGVLFPLAESLGQPRAVRLDRARVVPGKAVSATFEGRDLFAPAAARLAIGTLLDQLGDPVSFRPFKLPLPEKHGRRADGEVLHIDAFGNAISNVPTDWVPAAPSRVRATVGSRRRTLFRCRTYSEIPPGRVGVIGSSFGLLELALREARAADRLGLRVGSRLRFEWAK